MSRSFRQSASSGRSEASRGSGGSSPSGFGGSSFLPLSINFAGRRILISGGRSAIDDIRHFVESGAEVDVLASRVSSDIKELSLTFSHRLRIIRKPVSDAVAGKIDLGSYFMVLACSESDQDNRRLVEAAELVGVLASSRGASSGADFLLPTMFRRGRIKIAVSSDGASRALERALLQQIEMSLGSNIDRASLFAEVACELLESVREQALQMQSQSASGSVNALLEGLSDQEEVYLALQRLSYEEAEQRLKQAASAALNGSKEDEDA